MPGNLTNTRPNTRVLSKLVHDPSIQRISGFSNGKPQWQSDYYTDADFIQVAWPGTPRNYMPTTEPP